MEYIEINGFLTIDHAHFEIKKINILIGAQAQGKSVIAKLVYFFKKNFFSDVFIKYLEQLETKREIDKNFLTLFEQIFPRYSWEKQEFSIIYKYDKYNVSIIRTKVGNKYTLKFSYWNKLPDFRRKDTNSHKKIFEDFQVAHQNGKIDEFKETYKNRRKIRIEYSYETLLKNSKITDVFTKPIFIPAGRSFFANLQRNIFSFLANDIDIDHLIKEFGAYYESVKQLPNTFIIDEFDEIFIETVRKKLNELISEIIVGEYIHEERQDWILNNGKKTNLANASSGQQESIPMLITLTTLAFLYGKQNIATFFIEEPEAHLFPTSQKQIISLIATIYNAFGHSFFITTHSPYILTAINNLVVGKDAYDKANGDKKKLKRLEKVLPTDELIRLEDVSAYTLNKGKLESIIDMENRLIGANLLDAVSDEFDLAFGVATEILYGDD